MSNNAGAATRAALIAPLNFPQLKVERTRLLQRLTAEADAVDGSSGRRKSAILENPEPSTR